MKGDPRLQALLEEILETGRTPEEVCRGSPELLPELRRRRGRLRALEAEVEALFPVQSSGPATPVPADIEPPRLPGFEVQAVLGRGGMGIVFRAQDVRLGRPVAIKVLLAGAHARAEERERFRREAAAAAGLRHANIVQVYEVGCHEDRPFFSMEFV